MKRERERRSFNALSKSAVCGDEEEGEKKEMSIRSMSLFDPSQIVQEKNVDLRRYRQAKNMWEGRCTVTTLQVLPSTPFSLLPFSFYAYPGI
jgi:hypothetical protein